MPDPTSLADIVVLTVKASMAPLLERLAVAEAKAARVDSLERALTELRDKYVAMETKAAMLQPPEPWPGPPDLSPLEKRLTKLEESPVARPEDLKAINETLARRLDDVFVHEKEMSALRERLAIVETRQPIPGPPGKDGAPGLDGRDGKDGLNGKDGADGLGFDDMFVEFDGDRTATLTFQRGKEKRAWPLVFPYEKYQQVYSEGRSYVRGDCVTYAGSEWHCNETTSAKPGDGSKAWTLKVKRGRDGKDGRDAASIPIVTVGRPMP